MKEKICRLVVLAVFLAMLAVGCHLHQPPKGDSDSPPPAPEGCVVTRFTRGSDRTIPVRSGREEIQRDCRERRGSLRVSRVAVQCADGAASDHVYYRCDEDAQGTYDQEREELTALACCRTCSGRSDCPSEGWQVIEE